jgi:phage protein D
MDGSAGVTGGIVAVTIDGSDLSQSLRAALTAATVEQRLNLPAACTLTFTPLDYDQSTSAPLSLEGFDLGTPLTAAMGLDSSTALFSGKIAAIEPDFDGRARRIEVTGYDALFDLGFGTNCRTFENRTDSEMASEVIEAAGFAASVDSTTAAYPYVLQNNVSDMAFLSGRAARLGYELAADDRTVSFRKSRNGETAVATLEYGVTLTSFRGRMRALRQGSSVTRTGWDPQKKAVITQTVSSGSPDDLMGGEETGFSASEDYKASAETAPDPSIVDDATAESLAQGAYETSLDAFVEATAECPGNPKLKPGVNVTVSKIGGRFDGLYYVVATEHAFSVTEGYTTRLTLRRTGI